jgi:hypothetical protein
MNSPAEVANWRLIILAAVLALPLFIVLNGASVSLPESYFEVSGIPVHASALLFVLLPKRVLMNPKELIILLAFLSYCTFSIFDSGERLQLTIQLGYFIYGYKILRGLTMENVRVLDHYIAVIGSAFIFIHALSMGLAILSGNISSIGTQGVFGFVIYQSHLTYPVVLILILVSVVRSFSQRPILRIVVIASALFIEIILMRRVGVGLFLVFLFLFERRLLIFAILAILAACIAFEDFRETILEAFSLAERLTNFTNNGVFSRTMTWERSLERISDAGTILFGNGLNNHSHNFFLHTISTHGLIISLLFFAPISIWLYATTKKNEVFNRYSILMFVIVAVDWNLNTNLYQPYYALMFAFFLISYTSLTKRIHNE